MNNGKNKTDIKKTPQITIDTSRKGVVRTEVNVARSNRFVTYFILVVGFLFLLLPLTLLFIEELAIGFGYVITLILSWGCFVYFIRKALWGDRGKEVYDIQKGKIRYYYDYGFFRDNLTEKSYNSLRFGYRELDDNEIHVLSDSSEADRSNFNCYLCIIVDKEIVVSNILVSYKCLISLPSLVAENI